MESNTAAVANQPVNFPNFSVENAPYKIDPFTIRDGRYVGHDGFLVPKDFGEFHERFPQYVRNWVNRHADRSVPKEDVEDCAQDLLIHLLHLPSTSKHREAGKEDIVQTFDPNRHYGANQARFQNYINLCLANRFRTIHSRRMKDALSQPRNVSLDPAIDEDDSRCVDDEYCHAHSGYLREAANASEKQDRDRAFVQEFVGFVRREDQKSVAAVEALLARGTQQSAAHSLGISESRFARLLTRLRRLGEDCLSGKPAPRIRVRVKERSRFLS